MILFKSPNKTDYLCLSINISITSPPSNQSISLFEIPALFPRVKQFIRIRANSQAAPTNHPTPPVSVPWWDRS